jgi:hypothetical protein
MIRNDCIIVFEGPAALNCFHGESRAGIDFADSKVHSFSQYECRILAWPLNSLWRTNASISECGVVIDGIDRFKPFSFPLPVRHSIPHSLRLSSPLSHFILADAINSSIEASWRIYTTIVRLSARSTFRIKSAPSFSLHLSTLNAHLRQRQEPPFTSSALAPPHIPSLLPTLA